MSVIFFILQHITSQECQLSLVFFFVFTIIIMEAHAACVIIFFLHIIPSL